MPTISYHAAGGRLRSLSVQGAQVPQAQTPDLLSDALGSVVRTSTDGATGGRTARYLGYGALAYTAGMWQLPRSAWVGALGYRSTQLKHAEQYAGARHYSTGAGRWTTVDPLWPTEPKYAYVRGNPTNDVDPSGMCQVPIPVRPGEYPGTEGPLRPIGQPPFRPGTGQRPGSPMPGPGIPPNVGYQPYYGDPQDPIVEIFMLVDYLRGCVDRQFRRPDPNYTPKTIHLIPGRTGSSLWNKSRCDDASLMYLNSFIDEACKPHKERTSCTPNKKSGRRGLEWPKDKELILQLIERNKKCLKARKTRDWTCYGQNDRGHDEQIEGVENRLKGCLDLVPKQYK